MKEIIDEIEHQRELIGIHRDAIGHLNTTIALYGALTPPFIQLDKKERIREVGGIIKKTIEYLGPQTGSRVNDSINKLRVFLSIEAEKISTPDIDQVYQRFDDLITVLAVSDPEMQFTEPIKILFMAAEPDDNVRLQSEFDDIVDQVKGHIDNKSLVFLLPTWNTDHGKLLSRLNHDRPNVLHYSGHGDSNGIHLVNNVDNLTQVISSRYLADIFEDRKDYLQLVILNSCYSSDLAGIISKHGLYVLGVEGLIDTSLAVELARHFYLGFSAQRVPISIPKAITFGCRNFALSYPQHQSSIFVWKDGVKIDYDQI